MSLDSKEIVKEAIQKKYDLKEEDFILTNQTFKDTPILKHKIFKFAGSRHLAFFWNYVSVRNNDSKIIFLYKNLKGFEVFIREEGYQIGSNISSEEFLRIFLLFVNSNGIILIKSIDNIYFIDEDELKKRDYEFINEYTDKIIAPTITKNNGDTILEYWTWDTFTGDVTKWQLAISKDYSISYKELIKNKISTYLRDD